MYGKLWWHVVSARSHSTIADAITCTGSNSNTGEWKLLLGRVIVRFGH